MFKLKPKIIICLAAALILSACVRQPQPAPQLSLAERTQYLHSMQKWQADGKVGIRTKDQGHNASIEWQQSNQNFDLHLFGPFASGAIKLIGRPGQVTLTTSDGATYNAAQPETLAQQHLGWSLPFSNLRYWIKGLAAPHSAITKQKFDQSNQLIYLEQDGWQITYNSYETYLPITLPAKLALRKDDIQIKLIIKHWQK